MMEDKKSEPKPITTKKAKAPSTPPAITQGILNFDQRKLKKTETVVRKTCPINFKMELNTEPAPRFDPDDPDMLTYLGDYGYAVVKGVANESEIEKAKDLFWDFLEENAGMDRNKPKTWDDARLSKVGSVNNGILHAGFGQSDACWYVRMLPRIKLAFEAVWNTPELIVSFDGGNIFRPHHAPGKQGQKTLGGWWHVDQGHSKRGKQCIQGLVSLCDATPETGGLCLVPGSHRGHDKLLAQVPKANGDFVRVKSPASNPLMHDGKLIVCKAGDLILWDSRTIHCNSPSLRTPTEEGGYPHDELLRMVTYVCMTPRYKAMADVIEKRRKAFVAQIGTSHWPHEFHPEEHWDGIFDRIGEKEVQAAFVDQNVGEEQQSMIGDIL